MKVITLKNLKTFWENFKNMFYTKEEIDERFISRSGGVVDGTLELNSTPPLKVADSSLVTGFNAEMVGGCKIGATKDCILTRIDFPMYSDLISWGYLSSSYAFDTQDYLRALLIYLNAIDSSAKQSTYLGKFFPSSQGFGWVHIYNPNGNKELPNYSGGMFQNCTGGTVYSFGTNNNNFYCYTLSTISTLNLEPGEILIEKSSA